MKRTIVVVVLAFVFGIVVAPVYDANGVSAYKECNKQGVVTENVFLSDKDMDEVLLENAYIAKDTPVTVSAENERLGTCRVQIPEYDIDGYVSADYIDFAQ